MPPTSGLYAVLEGAYDIEMMYKGLVMGSAARGVLAGTQGGLSYRKLCSWASQKGPSNAAPASLMRSG